MAGQPADPVAWAASVAPAARAVARRRREQFLARAERRAQPHRIEYGAWSRAARQRSWDTLRASSENRRTRAISGVAHGALRHAQYVPDQPKTRSLAHTTRRRGTDPSANLGV